MTISKLSATLQNRIVANIRENVTKLINRGKEVKENKEPSKASTASNAKRTAEDFEEITTNNVVRILSNKSQIGVVSAASFRELQDSFANMSIGTSGVSPRVLAKAGKTGRYRVSGNLKRYKDLAEYISAQLRIIEDKSLANIKAKSKNKLEVSNQDPAVLDLVSQGLVKLTRDLATESQKVFSNPTKLYSDFVDYLTGKGFTLKGEKETTETTGRNVALISGLTHRQLNEEFKTYLKTKIKPHIADFIDANVDAGHLLGIFTQKLARFLGATTGSSIPDEALNAVLGTPNIPGTISFSLISEGENITKQEADALNSRFSKAFNLLENIDYLSSSLSFYPDIFAELSKTVYDGDSPSAAAEFQFALANQEIGRRLAQAGKQLNGLVRDIYNNSGKDAAGVNFAKRMEGILKEIGSIGGAAADLASKLPELENASLKSAVATVVANSEQFGRELLNSEGSDSILKAIGVIIGSKISGKKTPPKQVSKTPRIKNTAPKTKKAKPPSNKKVVVIDTTKKRSTAASGKTFKKAVAQAITALKVNVGTTNLTSLQNLINASLVERVKANMGRGERRDVLNLRTGRFAESVKVERMSQSREGMITAFYSYMKNPYATFSQGGAQDNPKSRDPKLLIAKSIREIAAQQVANRLRSVSV